MGENNNLTVEQIISKLEIGDKTFTKEVSGGVIKASHRSRLAWIDGTKKEYELILFMQGYVEIAAKPGTYILVIEKISSPRVPAGIMPSTWERDVQMTEQNFIRNTVLNMWLHKYDEQYRYKQASAMYGRLVYYEKRDMIDNIPVTEILKVKDDEVHT